MAISVRSTATYKEDDEICAPHELAEWLKSLPENAQLAPVTKDIGTQRDPWHVMVGVHAEWTEER